VTEAEWLAGTNPVLLWRYAWRSRGRRIATRRLRLLACAAVRRAWHLLSAASRRAVEVAEANADGRASAAELRLARVPFSNANLADGGRIWFFGGVASH
jgi:hypothetical protein